MKKYLTLILPICLLAVGTNAQVEPGAANWKPWLILEVKAYRMTPPANTPAEIKQVITHQQNLDSASWAQIFYWSAGAPGYRWHDMMNKLWMTDTSNKAALSNLLLGTAIYDATIAAWDS